MSDYESDPDSGDEPVLISEDINSWVRMPVKIIKHCPIFGYKKEDPLLALVAEPPIYGAFQRYHTARKSFKGKNNNWEAVLQAAKAELDNGRSAKYDVDPLLTEGWGDAEYKVNFLVTVVQFNQVQGGIWMSKGLEDQDSMVQAAFALFKFLMWANQPSNQDRRSVKKVREYHASLVRGEVLEFRRPRVTFLQNGFKMGSSNSTPNSSPASGAKIAGSLGGSASRRTRTSQGQFAPTARRSPRGITSSSPGVAASLRKPASSKRAKDLEVEPKPHDKTVPGSVMPWKWIVCGICICLMIAIVYVKLYPRTKYIELPVKDERGFLSRSFGLR